MSDRLIRAVISGDATGAVKAFKETSLASENAGKTAVKSGEEATAASETAGAKSSGAFGGIASKISGLLPVQAKVALGVGVALAAIGAGAIDLANKYDDSTARMAASSGQTIDEANKVGDAFLSTAGQTVFSAQTMMDAYGPVSAQIAQVAGHALSASDALAFMNQATTLASATGQDLNTTTKNLSDVMQAFHQPLSAASGDADALFTASSKLGMPLGDFVTQLDKLHAKLGDAGGDLNALSAGMLDFQEHGLSGRAAVSALTTATTSLESPSKAATDQLAAMGLAGQENALKTGNISTALEILGPKLQSMSQAQRQAAEIAIFGKSGYDQLNATLMAGKAGYDQASAAVTKHGTASAAATTATSTLSGSFDKIKGAAVDIGTQLGQKLTPALTTLMGAFATAATWLAQNLPTAIKVTGNIFSVVFAIIGVVIRIFATAFTVVFTIVRTEVQITVAIIQTIVGIVQRVVAGITVAIRTVAPVVSAVFGAIFTVVSTVMGVILAVVSAVWTVISTIFGVYATIVGGIMKGLVGALVAIWSVIYDVLVAPVVNAASGLFAVIGNIVGFFVALPGRIVGGLSGMGSTIWNFISGEFSIVYTNISGWIATAVSFFTGLPGKMGAAFASFGGDLAQGFKTAVNAAVINPINAALKFIGDLGGSVGPISFHIRDAFGGHMPSIPTLAMGGIVTAPTLALIGEAGPEAVVPLDRHPSAAGIGGDTHNHYYQITVNGADPNAVVVALRRYMQRNGAVPIKLAS